MKRKPRHVVNRAANTREDAASAAGGNTYRAPYPWRIAFAMLVGYLLATVPQVYLDQLIQSHVAFKPRHYPLAYLIAPIGGWVLVVTLYAVVRAPAHLQLLSLLPFIAGCTVSLPIFTPEVPHGNLLFVGIVWLLLGAVTIWVHAYPIMGLPKDSYRPTAQAQIEYVKAQSAVWKSIALGLLAAYLGVIVTLVRELHVANEALVSAPQDRFLLNGYINLEVTVMSLFMFVGPIYETVAKVLRTNQLLLEIHEPVTK